MGMSALPVYVCEWNNTPSQQDLLNDTCYKSCYIVKNILENYDRFAGLAYWSLTDLMAEAPLPEKFLFGGLGLFTANGLPKAGYYTLCLLRQPGDNFLASGNGWYAARTQVKISIIACHYKHISNLYAMGERFDMTETDRYTMFEPSESLYLELELQNMEDRQYILTEYILNRHHGSLYDAWIEMGSETPVSDTERGFLFLCLPKILSGFTRDWATFQYKLPLGSDNQIPRCMQRGIKLDAQQAECVLRTHWYVL